MDERPSEHTSPLGRVMPCVACGHDEHVLKCLADLGGGIFCPCRDVFVPGIYPAA